MPSQARIDALAAEAVREQLRSKGIVTVNHYENWVQGDIVGITGEAGRFKFWNVRLDSSGEPIYVTVIGGPVWGTAETKEWRTFTVDRLTNKISKRGKRKPREMIDDE